MRFAKYATLVFAVVGVLGLTGCNTTAADDRIAALNRAVSSKDELPHYVPTVGLRTDTVHHLVDHDGIAYFVAESKHDGLCVIHVKEQSTPVSAVVCGPGPVITSQTPQIPITIALVTDTHPGDEFDDDWTRIHDNLLIR